MTEEHATSQGQGRVAVVTGAGTGIGREIAASFGWLGWQVAAGGRRVEKLAETAKAVEDAGGSCLRHELDVTQADSVDGYTFSFVVGGRNGKGQGSL
jgi:NADP-dependent 3-hydroxy acid dehydrogenase YdfG